MPDQKALDNHMRESRFSANSSLTKMLGKTVCEVMSYRHTTMKNLALLRTGLTEPKRRDLINTLVSGVSILGSDVVNGPLFLHFVCNIVLELVSMSSSEGFASILAKLWPHVTPFRAIDAFRYIAWSTVLPQKKLSSETHILGIPSSGGWTMLGVQVAAAVHADIDEPEEV